jgi:hypothetical protein
MKTRFLIAAAALTVLAAPAFANAPSSSGVGTLSNDQIAKPQSGPDANGEAFTSPFTDRFRQDQTDMRSMTDRRRNNLLPPRGDASGVPDPRI